MPLEDLIKRTKQELVMRAQQYYDEVDEKVLEVFHEEDLIQSRFVDPLVRQKIYDYTDLYRKLDQLEGEIFSTDAIDNADLVNQINQFLVYQATTEAEECKKLHTVLANYIDLYTQQAAEEEQTKREHRIREQSDQITHTQDTVEERAIREELESIEEMKEQKE